MKTRIPVKLLAALTALCLLLSFGAFSAVADEDLAEGDAVVGAAEETAEEGEEIAEDVLALAPAAEAEPDATQGPALPAYPELQALNTNMDQALASGLAFNGLNSEFKILVFNDMNDGLFPYPALLKYIQYVLADVQPDLIVLNGDITRKGASAAGVTRFAIPWICDLFGTIPFTLTFGEQDSLLPVSKNNYLNRYRKYANCLAYDDEPTDAGVANHNLFIFNTPAGAAAQKLDFAAYNLWLMDTNADGLYRTQSAWYAAKEYDAIYLKANYIIPSMLFTHMPLPEIANVPAGASLGGTVNANMYQWMKEFGGVQAAVSGHHRSCLFDQAYVNENYSLRFLQRPGLAFLNSKDRYNRGASLITLKLTQLAAPAEKDENGNFKTASGAAPKVEISSVEHIPLWSYFDDDTPEGEIGPRHAFYMAGVSTFFGPLASLIGLIASPFTDKYDVTFKVTQFFGNTFNFML